jgi:hypothetical protein
MFRTRIVLLSIFLAAMVSSCNLISFAKNIRTITPSSTIVTEERSVSGFTGIDMSAFGEVTLQQGDNESLSIKGSDNVVPLVVTTIRNGVLTIRLEEGVTLTGINHENVLAFTITVKNLNSLTNSGAAKISMDTLSTQDLNVTLSGAGQVVFGQLTAESLYVKISGLGGIEAQGEANKAKVEISGAGNIKASNLKINTADVSLSGLGNAELWVVDNLTGNISGAGGVSYFGSPKSDTKTSGIGNFKSLGTK